MNLLKVIEQNRSGFTTFVESIFLHLIVTSTTEFKTNDVVNSFERKHLRILSAMQCLILSRVYRMGWRLHVHKHLITLQIYCTCRVHCLIVVPHWKYWLDAPECLLEFRYQRLFRYAWNKIWDEITLSGENLQHDIQNWMSLDS